MVPGPGSWVPSTADISAPPHMPWAITPWNKVASAYAGSRWAGLVSPETAAKAWMSDWLSVRTRRALCPMASSSNVMFSMKSSPAAAVQVVAVM